ncbi:MAG TPA: aminofutalosine synthase MqnE [Tepidisphaeraceae bacterium]|jgi:aminodeoxyfutalosine synthase|nr:aminofutalosine synthase MqnE [Tepidisphaeraceae bacterium]
MLTHEPPTKPTGSGTSVPLSSLKISDPALIPVMEKVIAGVPLSHPDGLSLYRSRDIHAIGRLANCVREKLHGHKTFYNRNRHINYTNVCALSCKFCSFYRKRGEEGAYEMPLEQVIATAKKASDAGVTEVHIVGGLHPWLKFEYYLDMLRGIRRECPNLHVKAFTAIEIVHFSRVAKMPIRDILAALRDAGLGSLPGGGAEIFDDRVHAEIFKGKVGENKWFEVHRTAHELGIYSNATMLYGHVETLEERVTHLIKLRDLQAESLRAMVSSSLSPQSSVLSTPPKASFNCVIPLSFIPDDSELGHLPGPTGLTDLKTLAIARLMLHNIPHIKAFWIMQSIHLAQLSLDWGVDDLDGTVTWYDITKGGSGASPQKSVHQELHVDDLKRIIREARRTPIERDTLYHELKRDISPNRDSEKEPLLTS